MTREEALRWAAVFRIGQLWAVARLNRAVGIVAVRVPGQGLAFCHTPEEVERLARALGGS